MTLQTHDILDLATKQLESSINLFLTGHLISSITLAGAADVLLCRLVENRGKKNFTQVLQENQSNPDKTKEQVGKEVNDIFHINALKHMNDRNDTSVTMNLRSSAYGAILKALPNYVELKGKEEVFVRMFITWIRKNLDPKIYNIYSDPNWRPSTD